MLSIRATAPLLLWLLLTPEAHGDGGPGFQPCEALFAAHPQAEKSAQCFYSLSSSASAAVAVQRLEELRARHPELPWLSFYLGTLEWDRPGAEELYRVAAGRFAATGEIQGELRARLNLYNRLANKGHVEEAAFEEQRAILLAKVSGDPNLIANVKNLEARALLNSGRDLGGASKLLAEAERTLFPGGPDNLKVAWLAVSGEVNLQIGRFDSAQKSFRRLADLAQSTNDRHNMGTAQYGLLRVLMERAAERPSDFGKEGILAQARKTLATAQSADKERSAEFILGKLTTGVESRNHFARCVETSATPALVSFCRGGWARKLAQEDPWKAQEVLRQAMAEMKKSEDPWLPLFFLGDQMRVSWRTQPPGQAIADSWQALDAVEALRRAQGPASQAGLFSTWSDDYYWFSGSLLARTDRSADDVAQAFAVTEHLRGRTLLEKLAGGQLKAPSRDEVAQRLPGIVEAIENVKRRVDDPRLPPRERENARQDGAALAAMKSEVERQLQSAVLRAPDQPERFAPLQEVREALAPDEALLSFQVAPKRDWTGDFGGGSWLTVVTRGATSVYPLPGREELRHLVEHLTKSFEIYETDPGESGNLSTLYQKLLAPALAALPPGIHRLVLVPDDDLHKLPFAALRPAEQASPLAVRYQITVAPSATLWLRWRRDVPRSAAVPALVLANPVRLGDDLPPLPLAAEEGEAVVEALGGGSLLRTEEGASEAFLKSADLGRYGILHFATHSVIDGEDPERSAVYLTPSPGVDGHLDIAGIVGLKMAGKVVVLSTCESARGKILRGEGVMSLARAFFQAGAHTVVGSLWPVEDRDGLKLFERFYRHLGAGASVAAALRAAQRDRIAAGVPLRAWAGFVVLGDGDLVPLRGRSRRSPHRFWIWALVLAGAVLSTLLARPRIARSRPRSHPASREPSVRPRHPR